MKIPQLLCSPNKWECASWILVGRVCVGDKRSVGKRKAGTFKRVGFTMEETSEGIIVLVGEEL